MNYLKMKDKSYSLTTIKFLGVLQANQILDLEKNVSLIDDNEIKGHHEKYAKIIDDEYAQKNLAGIHRKTHLSLKVAFPEMKSMITIIMMSKAQVKKKLK